MVLLRSILYFLMKAATNGSSVLVKSKFGMASKMGACGRQASARAQTKALSLAFATLPGQLKYLRGIIGQDILARSQITIDQKRMLLTAKQDSIGELDCQIDGPYAEANVDGKPGWYRIDTGAASTIHINEDKLRAVRAETHHGIGGALRVEKRRIERLTLGQSEFTNVEGFSLPLSAETEIISGNIGNKILRELILKLDFSQGRGSFRRTAP